MTQRFIVKTEQSFVYYGENRAAVFEREMHHVFDTEHQRIVDYDCGYYTAIDKCQQRNKMMEKNNVK